MSETEDKLQSLSQLQVNGDREALQHLKQAVAAGKHWYIALLEAMGLWCSSAEIYQGRSYHYLIDGEAFDWLSLAERLCLEVDGLIPEEEKVALLFAGKPPLELTPEEFRNLIGNAKYRTYLNYLYGVIVEEELHLAVEEEVRKEQLSSGFSREDRLQEEVYKRIYGSDMMTLLQRFRAEKKYPHRCSISLTEYREFTYWLFKYRLRHCDKARVASDTRKALQHLQRQQSGKSHCPPIGSPQKSSPVIELSPVDYSC